MPRLASIAMVTIAWRLATVSQCAQMARLFTAGAFVPPIVAFSITGTGTNAWMLVPFRRRSERWVAVRENDKSGSLCGLRLDGNFSRRLLVAGYHGRAYPAPSPGSEETTAESPDPFAVVGVFLLAWEQGSSIRVLGPRALIRNFFRSSLLKN